MGASPRTLAQPRTFVLEVGRDGFNAYVTTATVPNVGLDLFAASSSVTTFLKVLETIARQAGVIIVIDPGQEKET